MEKLYKIILLFVGLIAMNNTVQAQLDIPSPFPSETKEIGDAMLANLYATNSTLQFAYANEWGGVSNFNVAKQVTNFTNYPNPAITQTTIAYTLTAKANVNLRVIDLAGKQLAVLVKQEQAAGKQEYYWELSKNNITSGMYILILQVDGKIYSRKIIVQ